MMRGIASALLAFCFAAAPCAAADYTQYGAKWRVDLPEGAALSALFAGPGRGELQGRLLPEAFAVVAADVADAAGLRIARGSQLVRINGDGGVIKARQAYCTYRDIKHASLRPLRSNVVSNKLVCLVDNNADKAFDAIADCWAGHPNILVEVHCNKPLQAITPVTYDEPAPSAFSSELSWGYTRDVHDLIFWIGTFEHQSMFGKIRLTAEKLPYDLPLLGGLVSIDRIGSQRVDYTIKQPISSEVVTLCGFWSIIEPTKACR